MNIPVYDEKRQKGFIRHVTVRVAENTGEYLVTIVTGEEYFPKKEEFLSVLLKAHPEITTVVQNINNKFGSMVMGDKEKILYGDGYITDILCGKKFRISSGSFYQINKGQCENLYSYVLKNSGIKKSDTVIDAYCGTGTIGIICSDIAKKVTGCELNSKACEDAIVNAKLNGVENIKFENDDAGRFMKKLSRENRPADVVITDPPRQGCSIEFLKAVVEMSPREIVYISCEPKTQARDTNFLTKNGYKIKKCTPFDMFPYTNHVETVVLLSKGEIDSKKIRVEFSLEDMDTSGFQQGATYEQIKGRVLEQTGLKVSSLYISQIKRKCGLEVGQSYNLSKKENAKQPQCPPEKEKAIREAMKYFGMI
jgi:23S rRNA (uracil1939-C5)-methyltransferase